MKLDSLFTLGLSTCLASIDAHGHPIPVSDAYEFALECYADEDGEVIYFDLLRTYVRLPEVMPLAFAEGYNAEVKKYEARRARILALTYNVRCLAETLGFALDGDPSGYSLVDHGSGDAAQVLETENLSEVIDFLAAATKKEGF